MEGRRNDDRDVFRQTGVHDLYKNLVRVRRFHFRTQVVQYQQIFGKNPVKQIPFALHAQRTQFRDDVGHAGEHTVIAPVREFIHDLSGGKGLSGPCVPVNDHAGAFFQHFFEIRGVVKNYIGGPGVLPVVMGKIPTAELFHSKGLQPFFVFYNFHYR